VTSLASLAAHLLGAVPIAAVIAKPMGELTDEGPVATDFADIAGQEHVKRAIEVAAAGGHNLVMRGPPGSGKTLLARATPSILPPMTEDEAMEVTRIYSVAGLLTSGTGLLRWPPFRAPHHTVSNAGLVGGGSVPRPGEITLAHRGVLFLDELLEFDPRVIEMLRQPLEDRTVTISRARTSCTFPANFMLLAALNPCQCGYQGDPTRDCICPPQAISRYQRRLSGPLLDRIDLFATPAERALRRPSWPHHAKRRNDTTRGPRVRTNETRRGCQQYSPSSRRAAEPLGARLPPDPQGGAHSR